MPLLVPNSAEAHSLEIFLGKRASGNLTIDLYTNSWAPLDADGLAQYTKMGAVGGYAAINMTASSWSVVGGAPTVATFPEQSWTFTASAGPVWGYIVTDTTSLGLRWAEQFPAAVTITSSGDTIRVTPKFTFAKSGE